MPQTYVHSVPEKITIPHSEIMSRYKNKSEIVLDFGVPDKSIIIDSMEVIEYSFGEIERTSVSGNSINFSNTSKNKSISKISNTKNNEGFSGIVVSQNNPFFRTISINGINDKTDVTNSIISSNSIVNNQVFSSFSLTSGSQTFFKYVKFWLIKGQVIKWESFGIDKSQIVNNPSWNQKEYLEKKLAFDINEKKIQKESNRGGGLIAFFSMLLILTVTVVNAL